MKAINSNYIKRMLLSYLPILLVTVSMLIFIFISIINEINVRNAIQANQLTAAFVKNMVDSTLKGISFDAQKMIETSGELQLYLDGPTDRAREFDVSNMLSGLMVRYGLIDSIYLYRAKDGRVLDQSASRPIGQFPDRGYLRSSVERILTGVWSSPRVKENEVRTVSTLVHVTSLGLKIPRDSGSLGYLVINIKVSSLELLISQMIDRNVTQAQLFDTQGQPFFDGNGLAPSNNSLNAETVSDYTGWTYRMSIKGGRLLDLLFHGSTVWVTLALGAIVFAFGSTFYVTRRNYKPIEAILHRIDRFASVVKTAGPKENKNEFAFIDQAIERLITNNMVFQEKQQENLVIRRQQFLQTLLKGEFEDDRATWQQEWQHFGLEAGHFIVALLELDHYVQFGLKYSPNDQSLFKFIISSVAVESAEQQGRRIIAEWISKNQLVLLLLSDEGESLEHHLLQLSEQVRSWVEKHLEFTVTIGIGSAAHRESDIGRSFEDAAAAVSCKVTLGVNQIIDAVELQERQGGEWFDYLEMIRTIVRKLRMSESGWPGELLRLFHEMRVRHLRKDDVERLLHYLVFQLDYEMAETLPDEAKAWLQDAKPALLLALGQSDTLEQLERCFLIALEGLADHVRALVQNQRHHGLLSEIRSYVEGHYRDPNLSLTMLSDRFEINAKYLSQLFKESFGQNFIDFLMSLRMEHAKQLLRESEVSVQDISEMVGYVNTTSFIRAFKKFVGLSPGQYREAQSKEGVRSIH
ncbi:helix-turn-helix domain-containing protein [Paenibacillus mucilaginosus]|uniref:Transcriptional regulator, AraC family n=1 Tax=Paenibacillus mucilaginosus (strain KNP414) TaxID=1036673 RepID=F8FRP9_PAEMK|nr:helix-turn-helix domain-containing protein [Paenibacillus mucilaginosus]AEI40606.1 transcriptional regulator, AraC family [Paenibacillus mucilaginosus KNP414]MCG7216264.1 helix-turn-helix domain-containing protein [Paenibacillus mucilaginosus]WDM29755.1 helix-turn-helix domain-containing protein [Paenibacillus mucilaginosus]